MVEIEIAPNAKGDIKAIVDYVYRRSAQNAEILYNEILDKIYSLRQFPDRGHIVPEINNPSIREIKVFHFRIIYKTELSKVQVLTIHHSSRLFSNNPYFKDLFQ